MDPQQRLLLEVSDEVLHDGGKPALSSAQEQRIGVIVGTMTYNPYACAQMRCSPTSLTSHLPCITANRISWVFNLKGASQTIDSACSSSLQALGLAFAECRNSQGSLKVLVAGSSIILDPRSFVAAEGLRLLSSVDRCRTFDAEADGIARGLDVGLAVLHSFAGRCKFCILA